MELTSDPEVIIEKREGESITYRRSDGVRWRVTGKCDRRGLCMIGAVLGDTQVESVEQLAHMCKVLGKERLDSDLDVPLGPGYDSNCCPMIVEVLDGN